MKKIVKLFSLIMCMLFLTITIYADVKFKDVKSSDWFYKNVDEMVKLEVINGYEDGTFKPNNKVKADEFIKMVLIGMGYEVKNTDSLYWADGYIVKAEELGIVDKTFINDYRYELSREQACRIIAKTIKLKENAPDNKYAEYIKYAIRDYYLIADKYKQDCIDCYSYGIMQGDSLKNLNPKQSITRAETTAVILRMMNKERRLKCEFDTSKKPGETETKPTQSIKNPSSITVLDAEGKSHTFKAPTYNSKSIQEMVDIAYIMKNEILNTKGCEFFGANCENNYLGVSGFETNYKMNICIYPTEEQLRDINRYMNKASKYFDYCFNIDFSDYKSNYGPYKFTLTKLLDYVDDKNYLYNYDKYREYFLDYYKVTFEKTFKYLFEKEFETAWNLFMQALSNENVKSSEVETVINSRHFSISSNNSGITFNISLKNVK